MKLCQIYNERYQDGEMIIGGDSALAHWLGMPMGNMSIVLVGRPIDPHEIYMRIEEIYPNPQLSLLGKDNLTIKYLGIQFEIQYQSTYAKLLSTVDGVRVLALPEVTQDLCDEIAKLRNTIEESKQEWTAKYLHRCNEIVNQWSHNINPEYMFVGNMSEWLDEQLKYVNIDMMIDYKHCVELIDRLDVRNTLKDKLLNSRPQ